MEIYQSFIQFVLYVLIFKRPNAKSDSHQEENIDYDVLILGAGIAGITAAQELSKLGINNYVIIEGTDRIGGRVKEAKLGQTTVELGASWIHGLNGNPIYDLAKNSKLNLKENDYDDWMVIDEKGNDVTEQANTKCDVFYTANDYALEKRKGFLNQRCSSDYSYPSILAMAGWVAKDPVQEICELFDIDFSTSFPAEISSFKYFFGTLEEYPYGDEELYVFDENGFSLALRDMLKNISGLESKIKFNTTVSEIAYTADKVVVNTSQGEYTGKYALVTFNLGVLQHRAVTFQPPLPEQKNEAIFGFSISIYYNIYLKFPSTGPWFVPNNTEWTLYASSRRGYYPIWQNFEKNVPGSRIMHCSVMYEEAKRLDFLTDEEVKREAVEVLRILFGPNVPDAEGIAFHRWLSDPYQYGSYTDWPKGFNDDSFKYLKAPLGRLYFAGDAYDDNFGYLQAAYLSSVRETTKIAKRLTQSNQCCT